MRTTDSETLMRGLFQMSRRTEDWTGAWPGVEKRLEAQSRRHFESEGSSGLSGLWAALSPDYAKRKARLRPGAKILQFNGRLMASIVDEGHPEHVVVREPTSLFFGSDVPYGHYHQEGTAIMPRRAPFSPTPADMAEWAQEFRKYFDADLFKGYGGGVTPSARLALTGF